jgi:sugar O-acyltransferase (sialic acid O-acetyltransferase NeuD family)
MQLIGVFGAGGFGREVMPVARACVADSTEFAGAELVFVVDQPVEPIVNGHRVMSTELFLADPRAKSFNVAVGDGRHRERIAAQFIEAGARPFELRAANHVNLDSNTIGVGAILCPYTTVTSNARIGRFFHLNIYSYVAHDCVVGDFVTFAPAVRCNGRVIVEDHAYIGTGAVLKQGSDDKPIVIGRGAVVGMGAVVTRSVAAGETVVGNPAAPLSQRHRA